MVLDHGLVVEPENQVNNLREAEIKDSIESAELKLDKENLLKFLESKALSWHLERGVSLVRVCPEPNAFKMDFEVIAKLTLKQMLDEKRFSILIEDINRPWHKRTETTNLLISTVSEKIEAIALGIHSSRNLSE